MSPSSNKTADYRIVATGVSRFIIEEKSDYTNIWYPYKSYKSGIGILMTNYYDSVGEARKQIDYLRKIDQEYKDRQERDKKFVEEHPPLYY